MRGYRKEIDSSDEDKLEDNHIRNTELISNGTDDVYPYKPMTNRSKATMRDSSINFKPGIDEYNGFFGNYDQVTYNQTYDENFINGINTSESYYGHDLYKYTTDNPEVYETPEWKYDNGIDTSSTNEVRYQQDYYRGREMTARGLNRENCRQYPGQYRQGANRLSAPPTIQFTGMDEYPIPRYSYDGMTSNNINTQEPTPKKSTIPRRTKVNLQYIVGKNKRNVTFSKRKKGIMKKAFELATLTGSDILLLVASESGHIYTYATPRLKPIILENQESIQECLKKTEKNVEFESEEGA